MLINLRNREGKLIVKDVLDIDFDMSVEEENNKYIIDLTKHQNKTSFLLNGHKHPTCLKRQVM